MAKVKLAELQAQLIEEDWDAGQNPITELSEKDQGTLLGAVPPGVPPTKTEKEASQKAALVQHRAASAQAMVTATAHPGSFDWRNKSGGNYVTSIKNQGGCGSCVAFGTLSVVESAIRISKGNPNYATDLSEAHLFYCLKGDPSGCSNGWWPTGAYDKVKAKGVAKENFFPYVGTQQTCKVANGWQNQKVKITGYKHLTTVTAIKEWISKRGPVSACFEVFSDFYSYNTGVYRHVTGASVGWHCVSIIGYNDAGGYWICKNSWGSTWGNNGYVNIKYGQCSIEHYGMWGVEGLIDTTWVYGKKIQGLWSNSAPLNAWAFIQDEGWKKIANKNRENHLMLLTALIAAKNKGTTPSVHISNGLIDQIYA